MLATRVEFWHMTLNKENPQDKYDDALLLLFSVLFGVTYAFRISITESTNYNWHITFTDAPGYPTYHFVPYTISAAVVDIVPLVFAYYFVSRGGTTWIISKTRRILRWKLTSRDWKLAYVVMMSFSPYFAFHTVKLYVGHFAMSTHYPNRISEYSPNETYADILWIVVYLIAIGISTFRYRQARSMAAGDGMTTAGTAKSGEPE
jgi:hypothetical protein